MGNQQIETTMIVNGIPQEHTAGITIAALLLARGLDPAKGAVVVELNGEIIPGDMFEHTPLNPSDSIEIVHFVGGG